VYAARYNGPADFTVSYPHVWSAATALRVRVSATPPEKAQEYENDFECEYDASNGSLTISGGPVLYRDNIASAEALKLPTPDIMSIQSI
jgi:hypothetical protein